ATASPRPRTAATRRAACSARTTRPARSAPRGTRSPTPGSGSPARPAARRSAASPRRSARPSRRSPASATSGWTASAPSRHRSNRCGPIELIDEARELGEERLLGGHLDGVVLARVLGDALRHLGLLAQRLEEIALLEDEEIAAGLRAHRRRARLLEEQAALA